MKKIKLRDFLDTYGDGIHGTPLYDEDGEFYFINGNNLQNGEVIISSETPKISLSEYRRIYRPLGNRTILLSINGTLGNIAMYKGEKIALGKSACFLNVKEDKNLYFIKYVLSTQEFKKYISLVAHGSTIKNLAPSQVAEYEFEVPLPEIQDKIATTLGALDNKIDLNKKINATLEAMAKTLYDYWFVQFDFPDENGKPYKSSGGKMIYSPKLGRDIPVGWEIKHVADLTVVKTGKEDANFATVNGKFAYFTCGKDIVRCDVPAFEGHAVLLAGNGDFNVKHYTGKFNAYQRTYVLIPDDEKYYALLYIAIKNAINQLIKNSVGSIVKFITIGDVNSITLLAPKNDSLLKMLNILIYKIEQLQSENCRLAELRDWLLPMLMNGKIKF